MYMLLVLVSEIIVHLYVLQRYCLKCSSRSLEKNVSNMPMDQMVVHADIYMIRFSPMIPSRNIFFSFKRY